jgi:carbon-monoxide dehydrogenase large subunit
MAEPQDGRYVGRALKRVEDRRLLTGIGRYVDDVRLPGLLHVALLRSPHAHARIAAVETAAARSAPGVVAVVAGKEVSHLGTPPVMRIIPSMKVPPQPILADSIVRAAGVPVAAVVADDPARARDAVDLIRVEYELLPPVADPEAARRPDAPLLFAELGSNLSFAQTWRGGDPGAAFATAEHVVRLRIVQRRISGVPLEPRGVLAQHDPALDELTVWSSTQAPFFIRAALAETLSFPEQKIRVVAPEVGGGFGVKGSPYREEVLVAFLALRLGRPVKWVSTRNEDLLTTQHGRGAVAEGELALTREGKIAGLRASIVYGLGAQLSSSAAVPPSRHAVLLPGAYAIQNVEISSAGVLINTGPTGAYRGAGRPEATFMIERLMDEGARFLGLDPAEIRRRNFIPSAAFPYRTATGQVYDSGNYEAALEKALELVDYPRLRREQAAGRERGELLGIGLATYVEPAGLGWESGSVRFERTGAVTVVTGSSAHGQGHETTFAQIVADALGVDPGSVMVLHGDTRGAPQGIGTFGSRSTALGGSALVKAAAELREKGRRLAAMLLEAAVEDVQPASAGFQVKGVPDRRISWRQVAELAYRGMGLPKGEAPGLEATVFFTAGQEVFSFGASVAVVRVEPDTGRIEILRFVSVDDCGTVVNPLLVQGQLHGGLAQGIGQTLLEGIVYDEAGQLLTGSLMEYALPRADDMPPLLIEHTVTPSPLNPLGVKGVGEAGTIAAPPAIVNAVVDALSPLGVRHLDMPLTPENVWRAIHPKRP